jgi:carboxyl-terminal processing protease
MIQMKKNLSFTNILLYASIAILLFGSGYKYAEWQIKSSSKVQNSYSVFNTNGPEIKDKKGQNIDFQLFWETWDKVQEKYVDDSKVDPQKMFYGAIKGMVATLDDPYTFFLTPDENKQSKEELGGRFEGIGAQLGLKDNKVVVIAPLKDSPAEKAGLKAGDIVIKVDNKDIKGQTLTQVVSKIRGPKDTKVTITIMRGAEEKTMTITRDQIKVSSVEVTYENSNGKSIAHLKLSQFGETTNSEWDQAVDQISQKWQNKQIAGMVLDVRDNPGGYLDSAVYLASEFLERGNVVVKQETTNGTDRTYRVDHEGRLLDIPLVVLINQGSASASEILSGALRDYGRATLVGQKSFGKGSVQEALDLSNGAGLHVTIAKWILPKGDWIMGKGIEPKIKVENKVDQNNTTTASTDTQLQEAMKLIK